MNWLICLLRLLCITTVIHGTNGYKVLFVGAVGSKSHKNFYMPIAEELAKNGHQVTLLTPFPLKKAIYNIREIATPGGSVEQLNMNFFEQPAIPDLSTLSTYFAMCDKSLAHKQVQDLYQEKFDVILLSVFFCECYLAMVYHQQVPFIYVSPMGLLSPTAEAVGNPLYPAFLSVPVFDYRHPFTFLQRATAVMFETTGCFLIDQLVTELEQRCRSSGLYPVNAPPFSDIQRNVSMVFLNSVRELERPARPYVPGVVHAGGIHCRPAEPLPKDLQEWVDGAGEDGFIFFSLGSVVKPSDLPEKNRKVLIKVFGSLKQRVLWKWNTDTMDDLPKNVKLMKWLPQQDILGHPKLRLFMTHGGLFSTFESIYHGKPVLGFPVFADQMSNMKEVERQGWGMMVLWSEMTEDVVLQKINGIMDSTQMRQSVEMQSSIMKDQPISPKSAVAFWTEYVVRYNGARHLRCPIADMPWYKVYNVDVWSMIVLICLMVIWIIVRLLCAIVKCFRRTSKNKRD